MKKKEKHVFVDVYLDNNLGDDLMLKYLVNAYPTISFYAMSRNSVVKKTFLSCSNLNIILPEEFSHIEKKISVYIRLGGSIFQYHNWKKDISSFRKYLKLKRLRSTGIKVITIGSNLGPFLSRFGKTLAKKELSLNESIFVRDLESFTTIKKEFGLKNVQLFDDFVFEFQTELNKKPKSIQYDNDFINVGVTAYRSVIKPEYNLKLYEFLSNELIRIDSLVNKKLRVFLFAFDSEKENDLSAAFHIKKMIDSQLNVEIIPYLGNEKEFLNIFSRMNLNIVVRFHGAVLSDIFSIPYIPIAYSNKLQNYIEDVGHSHEIITLKEINDHSPRIDIKCAGNRRSNPKIGYLKMLDNLLIE